MYSMYAGVSALSSMMSLAVAVLMIIGLWKVFVKAGKPGWHAIIPFLNVYDIFDIAWTKKMGIATIILTASGAFVMIIGGIFAGTAAVGFGTGYYYGFGWNDLYDPGNLGVMGGIGVMIMAIGGILALIGAIFTLVAYVKLGRAFGKSGGFLVGLFFLSVIFICILGFGQAQYIGTEYRAATGPYNPYGNPGGYQNQGGYQNPGGYQNQGGYQNPGGYQNQGFQNQGYQNQGYQNTNYQNDTGFQDVNPATSGEAGTAGVKYCANCGQRLSEVNKFCPSCGTPVDR